MVNQISLVYRGRGSFAGVADGAVVFIKFQRSCKTLALKSHSESTLTDKISLKFDEMDWRACRFWLGSLASTLQA